jgi:hypothetical protein
MCMYIAEDEASPLTLNPHPQPNTHKQSIAAASLTASCLTVCAEVVKHVGEDEASRLSIAVVRVVQLAQLAQGSTLNVISVGVSAASSLSRCGGSRQQRQEKQQQQAAAAVAAVTRQDSRLHILQVWSATLDLNGCGEGPQKGRVSTLRSPPYQWVHTLMNRNRRTQ